MSIQLNVKDLDQVQLKGKKVILIETWALHVIVTFSFKSRGIVSTKELEKAMKD